ncbi:hypothetical protein DUNSADRAFT_13610 [Dunaliella salina]|uniref:TFIIS N-terminal domain-containing protein n=1 Tax=Dunaliella salina TaxID=3046 RepID=A0ABQ7G916_DUNSA|nr:hypothetical protein DUNSADRAFT_13610 [Dunaliella salina]|eukprot:KAF5831103.1 hypothetical protein DUNSADRAFT_13610 [Dunaliella salina]
MVSPTPPSQDHHASLHTYNSASQSASLQTKADKAAEGGEDLGEEEEGSEESEGEQEGDAGFIDDAAAAKEEEHIGSDVGEEPEDAGNQEPPPEAVDDAELQFGKNKKKKKAQESDTQMQHTVDNMVSLMEGMAEEDMEDHQQGKPAINKLRKLAEMEAFMCQRKYHEMFIHAGGLGVLKSWLEPYGDGTLPNVRVRQAVLKACKALPIDTGREDIRDNLKRSQLGSRIMFLAKCPDETQANKRAAVELVQQWSRPIFFDPDAEAEKRRAREHALLKARQQGLEQQRRQEEAEAEEAAMRAKAKLGQPGFRWHASRPQASKLDYVVEPQHDPMLQALAAQGGGSGGGGGKKDENRFQKKMNEVLRRQKGTTARAAAPSTDGRGITL